MGAQRGDAAEGRWGVMMAAAQAGDGAQYHKLLDEVLPVLRGIVHARMRDHGAAEDVVQNTLLSIHRARHTYRPERPFGPWMRAIARNAMIDSFRSTGRRREREVGVEAIELLASGETEPLGESGELSPVLREAMANLPQNQRDAVELIQLRGLSVAEAAARVGVSAGALKVRAHRGYRALRKALEGVELE